MKIPRTFASLFAAAAVFALPGAALFSFSLPPTPARAAAVPDPDRVATDKIRDLSGVLKVVQADFNELGKIGRDWRTTYRFKEMALTYKNPNKTRLEARILGASVVMVFNGNTKMVRAPLRKDVRDVTGQPGQKKNLLDLGIFARDYLATDWKAAYERNEGPLQVYKLTQRNSDNPAYEIVWVNPRTAITEKRHSFNGKGRRRMELRYLKPVQAAPGVFVPTHIEVYNQFGKLGGVQEMRDLKVNVGVSDDRFATS
jgi:outer membrane lipoprotein-sorting protein